MQKSFSYYFSMSNDLSKFAFKKLGFISKLELFVYVILSFLGKFSFLLRPIFAVADDNVGAMIAETHSLCIQKMFEGVSEKYWKLVVTYFVEDMFTIFALSMVFTPFFFLCFLNPKAIAIHIIAALFLGFTVFVVMAKRVKLTMIGFVAAYDNNLSMGDYFYNVKAAPNSACGNIIANEVIYFLIFHILPVGVAVYSFGWLFTFNGPFGGEGDAYLGLGSLLLVFFLYAFLLNRYALVKYTTLHLIAQDGCVKKKCIVAKRLASSNDEYAAVFAHNKADFEKIDISKGGN